MSDSNNVEVIDLGDVTKIGRLCLESSTKLKPLQESPLLEHFRRITKLPLKLNCKLPKNICDQCLDRLSQLKQFTRFLTHCKRSQEILKDFYNHAMLGECIVRRNVKVDGEMVLEMIRGVIPKTKYKTSFVNVRQGSTKAANIQNGSVITKADIPNLPLMPNSPLEALNFLTEQLPKYPQEILDDHMESSAKRESQNDFVLDNNQSIPNEMYNAMLLNVPRLLAFQVPIVFSNEIYNPSPENLASSLPGKTTITSSGIPDGEEKTAEEVVKQNQDIPDEEMKPDVDVEYQEFPKDVVQELQATFTNEMLKDPHNVPEQTPSKILHQDVPSLPKDITISEDTEENAQIPDKGMERTPKAEELLYEEFCNHLLQPESAEETFTNEDHNMNDAEVQPSSPVFIEVPSFPEEDYNDPNEESSEASQDDFIFQCDQCKFGTDYAELIVSHTFDVHGGMRKAWCTECKSFVDNLERHRLEFDGKCKAKRRRDELNAMCDRCGILVNICDFTKHQQGPCTDLKCTHCNFSATTSFRLDNHFKSKHKAKRTCRFCKRTGIVDMAGHRKENKECQHKCPKCDYRSLIKYHVDKHMSVHSEVRRFTCEKCGICLKGSSNLRRHRRLHDFGPEYQCTLCPRKFSTKPHMQGHMNLAHLGLKPYKCRFCESSFAYIMTRSWHSKKEHPDEYVPQARNKKVLNYKTRDLTVPLTERWFECEQCYKIYKTEKGFNDHKLKHSVMKDASSCSDRDYKTATRKNKRAHMRDIIPGIKERKLQTLNQSHALRKRRRLIDNFTNGN